MLDSLNSLKTEQSTRKQGLRKRGSKQKDCSYNLYRYLHESVTFFSPLGQPIHREVSSKFHHVTGGRTPSLPCIWFHFWFSFESVFHTRAQVFSPSSH